ncbi:alpha-tocopherol transfer protein-like [Uloborus diversus]|uniref:alpha-tocopherol transfer protein-like n=1 Tax=Uloborus diversus TaxID=327109 RepID=UPI00240A529B|nr:alpha-tocopherol transfer protein-like [Uloborus diversus]
MFVRTPEVGDPEILPFVMGYLPENYRRKAEIELRDTPEKRVQGLRLLKEMMKHEKSLCNTELDDDFLMQYLLFRKFNVDRALSTLKAYVKLRKKNPDMFRNFHFDRIVRTSTDRIAVFLPWRCPDGCAIILVQLDNWDPTVFPVEEVKRMVAVIVLQSLRDPMTQLNGFKVIFDVNSNPLRHLRYITPQNIYLLYHGTQECIPGRFKAVHFVNDSITFKAAWFIFKNFLTDKFRKRIFFHSKMESLFDHFPRSILPTKYGGTLEDYDMTEWLKDVMQPEKLATLGGTIQTTT